MGMFCYIYVNTFVSLSPVSGLSLESAAGYIASLSAGDKARLLAMLVSN